MTKHITIDNAQFDVADLTRFLQRGISVLAEMEANKDDFKALIEEAVAETKLDKKIISKFIKSRYAAKTKDIVAEAETLAALSAAVDE